MCACCPNVAFPVADAKTAASRTPSSSGVGFVVVGAGAVGMGSRTGGSGVGFVVPGPGTVGWG